MAGLGQRSDVVASHRSARRGEFSPQPRLPNKETTSSSTRTALSKGTLR